MHNPKKREKFATQVDSKLLAELKALAAREGRQIQSLVDEALADVIGKHDSGKANPRVLEIHRRSMTRFASLYERLSK